MQDDGLPERTRLGPPGRRRRRVPPARRRRPRGIASLIERLDASGDDGGEGAFARDAGVAASALRGLDVARDRHVCFIGKLIVSKGIDLLLAAWPLVPEARLVVVGFGGFRDGLLALLDALAERRPRRRARHRAGRARARGRPASAAAPSAGLPRDRRRRLLGRRPRPARARRPHRAPGARRARAAAGRLRGARLPQHLPRGLRDGGRRGGGVRRAADLRRALRREGGQRHARRGRAAAGARAGCRSRSTTTRCERSPRACARGCRRRTTCGPPRGPRSSPRRASASRGRAWPPGSSRRRRDGWRSCRPWPEIECRADGSSALQTRPASRIRRPCGGGRRARAERLLGAARGRRRQPHRGQAALRRRSAAPATCSRAPAPRAPRGRTSTRPSSGRSRTGCRARTSPAPSTARSCTPTATGSCRPSSSRATRPTTSPPTWRSRSPPAARTRACWPPPSSRPAAASPPSRRTAALQIDADPTGQLAFVTDAAHGHARADHGQDGQQVRHAARHRHRRQGQGRGRPERRRVAVPGRLHGRELHVLLLGARATARPACRASSPSSSRPAAAHPAGALKLPLVPSE